MSTYRFTNVSELLAELDEFISDTIKEAVDEEAEEKNQIIDSLEEEIRDLRDQLSDLEDLNNELSEQVELLLDE